MNPLNDKEYCGIIVHENSGTTEVNLYGANRKYMYGNVLSSQVALLEGKSCLAGGKMSHFWTDTPSVFEELIRNAKELKNE